MPTPRRLGLIEAGAATFAGRSRPSSPRSIRPTACPPPRTSRDGVGLRRAAPSAARDRLHHQPGQRKPVRDDGDCATLPRKANPPASRLSCGPIRAGPMLDKAGETAFDICAYAAHMAALMGSHIIKVKPPMEPLSHVARPRRSTSIARIDGSDMAARATATSCRPASTASLVVISVGEAKGTDAPAGRGGRPSMPAAATAPHRRPQRLPAPEGGRAEAARLDDRGLSLEDVRLLARCGRHAAGRRCGVSACAVSSLSAPCVYVPHAARTADFFFALARAACGVTSSAWRPFASVLRASIGPLRELPAHRASSPAWPPPRPEAGI